MIFDINYDEEKSQLLKASRGVDFNDVLQAFQQGNLLADIPNIAINRGGQSIYIISLKNYAYVVPYVLDVQKQEIFLKTVYPSRKYTKLYLNKGELS